MGEIDDATNRKSVVLRNLVLGRNTSAFAAATEIPLLSHSQFSTRSGSQCRGHK